jgi:hypothetical protein
VNSFLLTNILVFGNLWILYEIKITLRICGRIVRLLGNYGEKKKEERRWKKEDRTYKI